MVRVLVNAAAEGIVDGVSLIRGSLHGKYGFVGVSQLLQHRWMCGYCNPSCGSRDFEGFPFRMILIRVRERSEESNGDDIPFETHPRSVRLSPRRT